jgi:hypothetical protein
LLCVSCGGEKRDGARFCSGRGADVGLPCPRYAAKCLSGDHEICPLNSERAA